MREQEQFLQVLDRDEAERRFRAALDLTPRGIETVPLDAALGACWLPTSSRPSTCRRSTARTSTASPSSPRTRSARPRKSPRTRAARRRSDSHRRRADDRDSARHGRGDRHRRDGAARRRRRRDDRARRGRAAASCGSPERVTAGSGISFAGTDIAAGETVLRRGQLLTSRETGVLAAIGVAAVDVWRKPVVAILSTGDEIIAPGEPMQPATRLRLQRAGPRRRRARARRRADALGIVPDDVAALREQLAARARRLPTSCCSPAARARARATLSYRVVAELDDPGHRRARRRAEAGQADLPGGDRRAPGRRAARAFRRRRSSRSTSSSRRCFACWPAAAPRSEPSCRRGWP